MSEQRRENMSSLRGEQTDEVDRIVHAWTEQRPDLDSTPMHVLSRVARLARHLDLARRTAFAYCGLEPWEFDVLSALRRAGSPFSVTPGALMTELLVSSGTMTNRIDRLEAKGLVTRSRETQDRRVVSVTLTPRGQTVVDDAMETLLRREREILSPLLPAELTRVADLLRPLLVAFEKPTCD